MPFDSDAEHFGCAQCKLAEASEEKKAIILITKDNVFDETSQ
jgi:hypothetical protein